MIKTLVLFHLHSYSNNWRFVFLVLTVITFGIFCGNFARFTVSENLGYNSPYQIAFITAFLSLSSIFLATMLSAQLALKEIDNNFHFIYFALPISSKQFLWSRFISIYALSLGFTILLTCAFFIGREFSSEGMKSVPFNLAYYFQPVIIFSAINNLFILSITVSLGWLTKNKLYIYVSGLLIYVLYMVSMLFSSSPFMANNLPQKEEAQILSAIFDPFGLSAYFYQTAHLSIQQRNEDFISFSGMLLGNRIGILILSISTLLLTGKCFSIVKKVKSSKLKNNIVEISPPTFEFVSTEKTIKVNIKSLFSFLKLNLKYAVKSIPFILIVLSLLFAVGMEMYAEIEKGIRLPQKYPSSGLMVSAIIQNFYILGALIMVYYGNDLFWRSKNSNFHFIEASTPNVKIKFWSIWTALIILNLVLTTTLILEGVTFQLLYKYPNIESEIYARAYLFNSFPLVLIAGIVLIIQKLIKNKYLSLAISVVIVLLMATTLGKSIVKHPLLKILHTISFDYSDMNGFGRYENAFILRLIFGMTMVIYIMYFLHQNKKSFLKISFWTIGICGFIMLLILGNELTVGYLQKNSKTTEMAQINYEKQFRKFQNMPQPTITDVTTRIDLFPKLNAYCIKGNYTLENKTQVAINEILFNFSDGFEIRKAELKTEHETISVQNQYQIIQLKKPIVAHQQISFSFEMYYQWLPTNGHEPFNAIIENGSFIRISRYYPQIGYNSSHEIDNVKTRGHYQLGSKSKITPLEAPRVFIDDFISLDMTVSTDVDQTAIGIGELVKNWSEDNRNFFQFKTNSIPFRFAISSAKYAKKKENYKGKNIEVYYHPTHAENVAHLIKNAKISMDYCENNFGDYPFKTIRFAEISGFTKGFNATAYPTTIYMNENMSFHCNIMADKKQDVINELAGHELAHMWWGGNQIDPDEREGDVMLTESLAMYTEIMLLKKMYGKEKVQKNIAMHQDIFENEKGFSGDVPLIKVTGELTHISYSKGAVAMYKLSEIIGEDKVNMALCNFLDKHKYPKPKPISTDFLMEVYKISDVIHHKKIRLLFEE